MSWYSVFLDGRTWWDHGSQVRDFATGGFVGNLCFKHVIKKSSLHDRAKKYFGLHFAGTTICRMRAYSENATDRLLKQGIERPELLILSRQLNKKISKVAEEGLFKYLTFGFNFFKNFTCNCLPVANKSKAAAPKTAKKINQDMLNKIIKWIHINLKPDEEVDLYNVLRKGKVALATQKIMMISLRPICERAIKASMMGLAKVGGIKGYDKAVKRACAVLAFGIIYPAMMESFRFTVQTYPQYKLARNIRDLTDYLPNKLIMLLADIGIQFLGTMNSVRQALYWNEALDKSASREYKSLSLNVQMRSKRDLEKMKSIAFKHAKRPIARKIKDNALLKLMNVANNPAKVKSLVKMLVNEAVAIYWADLYKTHIYGLPVIK